jgi:hypothetical protein
VLWSKISGTVTTFHSHNLDMKLEICMSLPISSGSTRGVRHSSNVRALAYCYITIPLL